MKTNLFAALCYLLSACLWKANLPSRNPACDWIAITLLLLMCLYRIYRAGQRV